MSVLAANSNSIPEEPWLALGLLCQATSEPPPGFRRMQIVEARCHGSVGLQVNTQYLLWGLEYTHGCTCGDLEPRGTCRIPGPQKYVKHSSVWALVWRIRAILFSYFAGPGMSYIPSIRRIGENAEDGPTAPYSFIMFHSMVAPTTRRRRDTCPAGLPGYLQQFIWEPTHLSTTCLGFHPKISVRPVRVTGSIVHAVPL